MAEAALGGVSSTWASAVCLVGRTDPLIADDAAARLHRARLPPPPARPKWIPEFIDSLLRHGEPDYIARAG